ncbi:caspase domain-containing protein [Spinellus fusiger]|nr:caspase domain-containing protein [Spinellus fusiger]
MSYGSSHYEYSSQLPSIKSHTSTYTHSEEGPTESYEEHSYSQGQTTYHYSKKYSSSYTQEVQDEEHEYSVSSENIENLGPCTSQPPMSKHNPAPHPVPYANPHARPTATDSEIYLHTNPKLKDSKPPVFQLSNCQGRKRALLIGINYTGTSNQLNGCVNDVNNVKDFLISLYGFKENDMVILTDDQETPAFIPTRENILAGMDWLVHDNQPNDSFFFHYSGHGGSVVDLNGDEADGYDETIYPSDFESFEGTSGQIIDDIMHDRLVKPLCKGCRLTAIFDSCHSGTALDLPYVYSTRGVIKQQNLFKDAGMGLLSAGMVYASGDRSAALSSILSLGEKLFNAHDVEDELRRTNSSPADVVMLSGCKDDQTSADAKEAGKATGAMSYAFTTTLRSNPKQSYQELLNSVRDILRDKYSQRPQLSCSHPIDVGLEFLC